MAMSRFELLSFEDEIRFHQKDLVPICLSVWGSPGSSEVTHPCKIFLVRAFE